MNSDCQSFQDALLLSSPTMYLAVIKTKSPIFFTDFFKSIYLQSTISSRRNRERQLLEDAKKIFEEYSQKDFASEYRIELGKKISLKQEFNRMMEQAEEIFSSIKKNPSNLELVSQLIQFNREMFDISILIERANIKANVLNEVRLFQSKHLTSLEATILTLNSKYKKAQQTSNSACMLSFSTQIEYVTQKRDIFEKAWEKMDKTEINTSVRSRFWH